MKAATLTNWTRRRGRLGLVVALAAVVGALCWWCGLLEPEPSYQGQTATGWLESVENTGDWPTAMAAFRAMGPKGVRFLARTLEKEPVQLPASIQKFLEKLHLPTRFMESEATQLGYRQEAAAGMLQRLGSDAAPATPILVRMFRHSDEDAAGVAILLQPMADKLQFMAPELIKYLGQNKQDERRTIADIWLLAAIGPKAKEALPVLLKLSQPGNPATTPAAAVALWNIAGETNELIRSLSNSLRSHSRAACYVLSELDRAVPLPKPLVPILEKALRHPDPMVRQAAESWLDKIDPGRLRQIEAELNGRQDELLPDHLKLLQSTNRLDRFNAARALQFFGAKAASAAPRLVEILRLPRKPFDPQMVGIDDQFAAFWTLKSLGSNASAVTPELIGLLRSNQPGASEICEILGEIGPQAAEAIPALQALLATNYVTVTNRNRGLQSLRLPRAFPQEIIPRWKTAQALALIDPHQSNAIAILRETQAIKRGHALWKSNVIGEETSFPATITLWKLGLETNLPLDELMVRADAWTFDRLGDIGPAAKKALPVIEKALQHRPRQLDAVLALRKIDPEEADRLGLPGIFIICPEKY